MKKKLQKKAAKYNKPSNMYVEQHHSNNKLSYHYFFFFRSIKDVKEHNIHKSNLMRRSQETEIKGKKKKKEEKKKKSKKNDFLKVIKLGRLSKKIERELIGCGNEEVEIIRP
jgi:hypothetical protein